MDALIQSLVQANFAPERIAPQAPMAQYTTLRIGGPAEVMVNIHSADEIAVALRAAKQADAPVTIIGNGSNLLVHDGGIRGLVLRISGGLNAIRREGDCLLVQAGASLAAVAAFARDEGLSGMAELGGIPGTVGGGVYMNAGAYGGEIRAVCLSKLALREDSVVWDVGAGTGSVTVEAAMAARRGRVYAVERKDAAFDILRENLRRFHTDNVTPVSGTAPDACADLPAPTHAFLGGTTGHMKEIIALLLEKNPRVRIVATAVTLESVAELTECVKAFPFRETEAVSLTAARSRKAGAYHLMTGQNPVYIFTMQG